MNSDNDKNKRNSDNFIMLPTVDFCFKELMKNAKVRKGFVAAILGQDPETIRKTILVPTELRKESEDDKPCPVLYEQSLQRTAPEGGRL